MGNTPGTQIYNSTEETVKICLLDTNGLETTAVISSNNSWSKQTPDGWNTIIIIPLNDNQNTFSYTLESPRSIIIKKKLGKLILTPSGYSVTTEMDVTISGHKCCGKGDSHFVPGYGCFTMGCIVFNETNEPIRFCVTDYNQRNTQMILSHGEHNIVEVPKKSVSLATSTMNHYLPFAQGISSTILVSVLDFNPVNEQNFIARAKYSIESDMHFFNSMNGISQYKFLRVIKIDGHFTIQEDSIDLSKLHDHQNVPYSYLLSRECSEKVGRFGHLSKLIRKPDGTYDVVRLEVDNCCVA